MRKEKRTFEELEALRKSKGLAVMPPSYGLAARALGYGTLLCGIGATAAWMVVQYTLGVRNVSALLLHVHPFVQGI